jgi:hypothetical protein
MTAPTPRHGSSIETRTAHYQIPRGELARVRYARDARFATMLFTIAVGAVLAVSGLENVGLVMGAVAIPQAMAAGYSQLRLWRLRLRRLGEMTT